MGGRTDEVKGRIKEAAGALIDNDELRTEARHSLTRSST